LIYQENKLHQKNKLKGECVKKFIILKTLIILIIQTIKISPYYVYKPSEYYIFTPDSTDEFPAAVFLGEADRILLNLQSSLYEHSTTVTETTGEYKVDCSGLTSYILRYTLNNHYNIVDDAKTVGASRPLAADFCHFFDDSPTTSDLTLNEIGFIKIPYLKDAKPGDILAIEYPDGEDNTGHTVIIHVWPYNTGDMTDSTGEAPGSVYLEYEVMVLDASSGTHGQDTRNNTPYYPASEGIGTGNMYFGVNAAGEIKYHKWSSQAGSANFDDCYTIGRLISFPSISYLTIFDFNP
jgi:hypothetical protein